MRSPVLRRALALAAVLLLILPSAVLGAVSTDQADYSPGSIVTINGDNSNGAGYLPGETVHVNVSGPNGYAASCDAVADGSGAWSCQVTLWNSDLAVGTYNYTATGDQSGVTESGTFTDAKALDFDGTASAFAWFHTNDLPKGFDVPVGTPGGTYTCSNSSSPTQDCDAVTKITFTVPGITGFLDVPVSSTGPGVAWPSSIVLRFRTDGSGDFLIPGGGMDGMWDLVATLTYTRSATPTTQTVADTASDFFGVDDAAPNPPVFTGSAPPSGSDNTSPKIEGTSEAGSTVNLYTNSTCTSAIAGTDTANAPGNFSAEVIVADGSTTTFWGTATDPAGNTSACSTSSFTYVEFSPPTNTPPTVDAGGPYTGDEGETVSISGSATDIDPDPLTLKWTYTVDTADAGTTCSFADDTAANTTINCTDDGTFTLTLTATGDPDGPVSDTAGLTLDNVAPDASANATPFVYDHYTGVATAKLDFGDDGTNDTHTATFAWSHGVPGTPSVSETKGAGTATGTATFAPGCYTITVTGHATDDELADSSEQPIVADYQVDIYTVQFLAPIKDNERNFAKYGNVLPVKVKVTSSCTGLSILTDNLYVSYVKGTGGEIIEGTETIGETVSSADGSGGQMRTTDEFYIYNFTTKPLTCYVDYTLRVRVGNASGPIILAAVLQLKK